MKGKQDLSKMLDKCPNCGHVLHPAGLLPRATKPGKKYRGTSRVKKGGGFNAFFRGGYLGYFKHEMAAAKAYDVAAYAALGEFAKLNFPRKLVVEK